jgi:hypothetical protein
MLVRVLPNVEETVPAIKRMVVFSAIQSFFSIGLEYLLLVELRYFVKLIDNLK